MTTDDAVLHLPWVLTSGFEVVATELLSLYCGLSGKGKPYGGMLFQQIGGRGDAPEWRDVIRAEDVLAVSALSVNVPPSAALDLLGAQAGAISGLLRRIPVGLDLADEEADVSASSPASDLWFLLREIGGIGPTTTSKLMARKRPHLIPIFDTVVAAVLGLRDSRGHWGGMRQLVRANGSELHERALDLRTAADGPSDLEPLRVLDIVLWMHGMDLERSRVIAQGNGLVPPAGPDRIVVRTRQR
jgi:hypothetical protein